MPHIILPERAVAVPLLIHRWFSDGALLRVADELKPLRDQWNAVVTAATTDHNENLLRHHQLDCGLLLISKVADPDCPDPLARERGPTILRCCLLTDEQIRRISVDRTAVLYIATLLLQNLDLPRERHEPCPLHLQIPVCEPDFRLPVAVDETEQHFRDTVLEQLRQQKQQIDLLLNWYQPASTEQPPDSSRSWWQVLRGLLGR